MRRFGTARKKFPLLSVFVTLCFVFPNVSQNVANAQPDETMVPFPKRFAPVRSLVKKKPKEEEEKRKGRPEKRGSAQEAGTKKKFKPKPFGRFEKKRLTSPKSFSASGAAVGGGRTTAENPDFTVYPDSIPEYLIGHEDVLEISVWKNSELSKTVMVRPDGMVSLPLIGDVLAAGRTPDELRQVITQRLQEYQENVIVSVIVAQVNSYRIYVLGEVVKPGVLALKRKTTLLQAIALAGGFNQFASKNKIMIIRERRSPAGREEKRVVRFDDIINTEDSRSNLFLRTGDTIFVP